MPKLIISGVTHELVDEAITIGRGPDNTIVVNDPSISTHHAQLLLERDTYRLKDLDSTNGTRVNGKPVTETVLRFDDRIRFGAAEARYESSGVGGSKPLPKPEEIKAQFAEAGAELPNLTASSPFVASNRRTTRCALEFSSAWALCCWSFSEASLRC
jgi:pSer/pThr/pTyr-binding forkhead associated (FHA) protein